MPKGDNSGGKRTGAGRRKGVTRLNTPNTEPSSALVKADSDVPKGTFGGPQPSIWGDGPNPRQRTFAAMVVRGKSIDKICEELPLDRGTAYKWLKEPWWPQVEMEERQILLGNPVAVFQEMLPNAIETYRKALEEDNAKLAIEVATQIFDRLYGKAVVRQQTESRQSVVIQFIDVPDEIKAKEVIEGESRVIE